MNALVVLRRELRAYFASPLAWVLLTVFLLVQGYSFYLFLELLSQPQAPHGAALQYFFGGTFLYWLFLIFLVAVLTMRLLAEERRSGTLEMLLTAPVSEGQVVLGKYLAALLCYLFLWTPTLIYVVIVARLSAAQGTVVGWGPVAAGYLGTLLVGAACLAVGVLASALVRHQILAAALTFALLSLLLLLGPLDLFVASPTLKGIAQHLNLFDHMEDFARGIVDTRRVVLHLGLVIFSLLAATKALELKKWR